MRRFALFRSESGSQEIRECTVKVGAAHPFCNGECVVLVVVTILLRKASSPIARQVMSRSEVKVQGKLLPISLTSRHQLRTLAFTMGGRKYLAVEQNAKKPSSWGQLAREGHQVVQFKEVETNRFVAVAVDGVVTIYGGRERGTTARLIR